MIRLTFVLFLSSSSPAVGRTKNARHDINLIEFIRNHSEHAQGTILKEQYSEGHGLRHDTSKRVRINRARKTDVGKEDKLTELARQADLAGPQEEDLRHMSLEEWKKKKKAVRMAHKEAGTKPLGGNRLRRPPPCT